MCLSIAVCDDAKNDCQILEGLLHAFCANQKLKAQIDLFSCGEDFLASHHKNAYDIVFMDIYLTGTSGIDTVINAHRHTNRCQVIFTSTSREYALEAFNLNAVHYLLKPLTKDSIKEAMERCLLRIGLKPSEHLDIKTSQGIVPIPIDNIIYIEVFNKICIIHTKKNDFQTYSSLDALFELLDNNLFMRPQRSYVVNMHFIESFFFDHIILLGGTEIVLSRTNRTELKKQYQEFLFHLARNGEI